MHFPMEYQAVKAAALRLQLRTEAFIDGKFQKAQSEQTFVSENPATGRPLARIAACGAADVDRAVASARKAFAGGAWSRMSPAGRKKVLLAFADLLEANAGELALLDTLEGGKPIGDTTTIDIPDTIHCIRWHAEIIDKIYHHVAPTPQENLGLVVREPVGVVACVTPWNFPAQLAAWKIGPALAGGNSVVLKPARFTSLSVIRMAELAAEAGLPPGVFNVVPGFGTTAGQALGRHQDVDMVTFTGSTEVGRHFLQYSSESNLKMVALELGGKSPQVVFADAPDLDRVATQVIAGAFWNMGENCSCGSRLVVHRDIKDELLAKVAAQAGALKVGDPLDPATRQGPMIEKPHMEKVLGYIEAGKAEGARLVMGGRQTLQETGGYFIEVTLFDEVANRMKIAQEEIFGPVLVVIPFSTEAEAVAIANDTPYGLAASLYTRDLATAHRVARAIRAGTVSVNCFSEGDITTPFGGYKQSGFAGRDKSVWAHEQYTELKTIWMQLD
jgi:gamma-glutamyl-gamma-aminobutyraldehyde dehydrogenase